MLEYYGMMSLLNRQIEAFRAVMLTGSMTMAGATLYITQPAVSRLIRDLELDLKFELFRRRGNQITPTPEANALFEEVERSFLALDHLRDFAKELSGARSGSLRIASLPAMAMGFLPRCIAQFVAQKPNLSILLDGMPSHLVLERVASGQFDFGFAHVLTDRPSLVVKPLRAEAVVVLPSDHRLASVGILNARHLKGERIIMLGRGSYMRHCVETALANPSSQNSIETPLSAIACSLVREGLGVTIVDPFSAASVEGTGVIVRQFKPAISVDFALVTPKHRPLSKLAHDFIGSLPITWA